MPSDGLRHRLVQREEFRTNRRVEVTRGNLVRQCRCGRPAVGLVPALPIGAEPTLATAVLVTPLVVTARPVVTATLAAPEATLAGVTTTEVTITALSAARVPAPETTLARTGPEPTLTGVTVPSETTGPGVTVTRTGAETTLTPVTTGTTIAALPATETTLTGVTTTEATGT
ncbi:hypothetical protein ACIG87_25450, partial [Micromonospora sp. NPDC051925]|uniref:hypothetical protein n=1 Tax=Micromonospora sp. NPDC051925 TaxID=3364288 RepID=UPI0037C8E811